MAQVVKTYANFTKATLVAELNKRKLPIDGLVQVLRNRLMVC